MRRRVEQDYSWNGSAWTETNEIHFIYDGNIVIQERDINNLSQATYTRGNDLSQTLQGAGGIGGLLARTANSQLLTSSSFAHAYYHADGNGNVTFLIYTNQMIAAKYLYDPFGNTLSMSGPLADANRYRFSSKEWNDNAGLYYYLYRFYDPNLQRWPNRDPIGEEGGINLYEFVKDDPIDILDFLGRDCSDPCGQAKAGGLDKGAGGGVICCGGKKYACNWFKSSGSKGDQILSKCIVEHEKQHFDDVDCGDCKDSPSRPPFKPGRDPKAGECAAYKVEMNCLKNSDCGGDPVCQARVEQREKQIQVQIDLNCGKTK